MLVLTRRPGETIKIGEDIEVTVLAIKGNQARIGIKAPREVNIVREEIADGAARFLQGVKKTMKADP